MTFGWILARPSGFSFHPLVIFGIIVWVLVGSIYAKNTLNLNFETGIFVLLKLCYYGENTGTFHKVLRRLT